MSGRRTATIRTPVLRVGIAAVLLGSLWPVWTFDEERIGVTRADVASLFYDVPGEGRTPIPRAIGGNDARALEDMAARIASRSPLIAQPFLIQAFLRAAQGRPDEAERLAVRALRLDPRDRQVRAWLITNALASGRLREGLAEIAALYRLEPEAGAAFTGVLVRLAPDPEARRLLIAQFANTPAMNDIVRVASKSDVDRAGVVQLLRETRSLADVKVRDDAIGTLVQELIEKREPNAAFDLWSSLFAPDSGDLVFDGRFRGLPGGPPFGWTYAGNEFVQTDLVKAGTGAAGTGVRIDSFGSSPFVALKQARTLASGTYVLRADVRAGDFAVPSAAAPFRWVVRCLSPDQAIAELGIEAGPQWKTQAWTFAVPSGCGLQELQLEAVPPESATGRQSVTVTNVALQAAR